jgi:hypothetical protein
MENTPNYTLSAGYIIHNKTAMEHFMPACSLQGIVTCGRGKSITDKGSIVMVQDRRNTTFSKAGCWFLALPRWLRWHFSGVLCFQLLPCHGRPKFNYQKRYK